MTLVALTPRVLPVLLLALLATPARAQLDTPTSPLPVFQLAERHDWMLRVLLDDGGIVQGRVREIAGDVIRLDGARFAAADVDAVARRVRHRGSALEGAIVGGVALGTLTLWLLSDDSGDESVDWALTAAVVGGAAVGAVIGGIAGARVDPAETDWLPVWPAGE